MIFSLSTVVKLVYRFMMLPKTATDIPATMIVVGVAPSHTIRSGASADFNVRTVLMNAIRCGASLVVLSHNHPSGLALPSAADQTATDRVQRALDTVGIQLLDHIVVADGDYVSMAQNGTLRRAPL